MAIIRVHGKEYMHERTDDGGDRLSYQHASGFAVALEFPSESEPGVTDDVIRILSDVFITNITNHHR